MSGAVIRAVDVAAELAGLTMLRGRSASTPADQVKAAFAVLAPFRDGSVFAGRFAGETAWDRHGGGDATGGRPDRAAPRPIIGAGRPRGLAPPAPPRLPAGRGHR